MLLFTVGRLILKGYFNCTDLCITGHIVLDLCITGHIVIDLCIAGHIVLDLCIAGHIVIYFLVFTL